ncbi:MAG: FlgB family protein [Pseudomonadota bacterium]
MFTDMEILRLAQSLASHAGTRQSVIAQNVANADTPGYRAKTVTDFAALVTDTHGQMRSSRPGHLSGSSTANLAEVVDGGGREAPNGNTVSLEAEMMRAGETRHAHDLALSVYRSSLDILRMSVGRR